MTLLLSFFVMQYVVMSWMLFRRGVASEYIVGSASPLLFIWVIFWPVYHHFSFILYGLVLISLPLVIAQWPYAIMQQLKLSWSIPEFGFMPMIVLVLNLSVAAILFYLEAAFGFAIALSLCLASSMASFADKKEHIKLFLPFNPEQTLWGHVILLFMITLLCSWSLHIYFSVPQMATLSISAFAALAASLGRALFPHAWSNTGVLVGMAAALWLF
ncbi:MAG: hypothetical protein Q9M28_07595 [Mariprofundaceae bacterium]|nr:hypothetical protein [Mariprofundaceae bacterium]